MLRVIVERGTNRLGLFHKQETVGALVGVLNGQQVRRWLMTIKGKVSYSACL